MTRNFSKIAFAASVSMAMVMISAPSVFALDRYEAQDAIVANSGGSYPPLKTELATASNGFYVQMREGDLSFSVTVPAAGFYTILAKFSQTCDDAKDQYLVINGTAAGKMSFPMTGPYESKQTCGPPVFTDGAKKIAAKVKFNAGANTVGITKDWGWVDIDYIEVGPHEDEPFTLNRNLVTPDASENARKVYQFMRENFLKKVISGVMVGYDLQKSWLVPHELETLPETKHVFDKSGKYPALVGLDFFHGTAYDSHPASTEWYIAQNDAAIALGVELFGKGGIPHFMWHWKNPSKVLGPGEGKDNMFYSNTSLSEKGKPDGTKFDLGEAFTDNSYTAWNTASDEYKFIVEDIDTVSRYLKDLADKGVAVLWRPLHEAAGTWFWWGVRGPVANKMLWKLMFERMVNHHKLDNLIWVWTCEEGNGGDPLAWYPGDEYVDIVGRDYYYWPDAQNKQEYGSLVSNFENLKSLYGGKKIIALSEQGTVPDPDSLVNDGAGWSFFMSWNESFLRTANPDAHWNRVMNHPYVIALDDMPGWDDYKVTSARQIGVKARSAQPLMAAKMRRGALELSVRGVDVKRVELFNLRGARVAVLSKDNLGEGTHRFAVKRKARQMYFVRAVSVDGRVLTLPVRVE